MEYIPLTQKMPHLIKNVQVSAMLPTRHTKVTKEKLICRSKVMNIITP